MSFKNGYMAQRSARVREADSRVSLAAGKKDRGAELLIQPAPSRIFHSSFSHSQCAPCNG